jgi:predicted phage-related endonuclease
MFNLELGKITQLSCEAGSPEWHYERGISFCASDATVLMGAMPGKTRDDLLKEKFTGISKTVSDYTEKVVFAKGHRVEELARPIAEKRLDVDLTPEVFVRTVNGMRFLASLDGIEMPTRHTAWECKQFNKELFEIVSTGGELTEKHYWQLEQQILVADIKDHYFACADEKDDCYAQIGYTSKPERREKLVLAWKQFEIDLANYVLPEAEAAKAIAEPVETLPAITYSTDFKSTGLELRSNIEAFKAAAQRLVEQSKKTLESDQDFANAEARIKSCKAAEDKISVIQNNVVGEVADIDKFVKDLGAISEMLRQCRLNEDKQVKARKEAIKNDAIRDAQESFATHIDFICKGLSQYGVTMPVIHVDFAGAIKGLKTISSVAGKLNDVIAQGKIEAQAMENKIRSNLELLDHIAEGYSHLFYDKQNLVVNTSEYIAAVAKQRIAEYEAKEQARIQAEAQRIASEQIERDRFNQEQIAKREQAEAQAAERAKAQAAALEAVKPLQADISKIEPVAGINTPQNFSRDDYDHFMLTSDNSFDETFNAALAEPEPIADMSDFFAGKMAAYAEIANLFFDCKNQGRNFEQEFSELYQRNKLPRKAA